MTSYSLIHAGFGFLSGAIIMSANLLVSLLYLLIIYSRILWDIVCGAFIFIE